MSRHFYLPPNPNIPAPKADKTDDGNLKQRLRMALSVLGIAVVTLLIWWYFTSDERWDAPPRTMSYLGSTSSDSARPPMPGSGVTDGQGVQTSAAVSASNVVNTVPKPVVDHPVRLEVWNGCGEKGLAMRATTALRAKGTFFDVRGMGNAGKDRYEFSSVVGRTADSSLAVSVADSLGIDRSRVTTEIPRSPRDIDVTVIIGADYPRLNLNLKPDSRE